jgi:hypothetical protein
MYILRISVFSEYRNAGIVCVSTVLKKCAFRLPDNLNLKFRTVRNNNSDTKR